MMVLRLICRPIFAVWDAFWNCMANIDAKIPRPLPDRIIAAIFISAWGMMAEFFLWLIRRDDPARFAEIVSGENAIGFELCIVGLTLIPMIVLPVFSFIFGGFLFVPFFFSETEALNILGGHGPEMCRPCWWVWWDHPMRPPPAVGSRRWLEAFDKAIRQ